MSRSEINNKILDIIEFAGLHQFIDAPLFTYSSGMTLRLGFTVAIHASPKILIIDETFAVGDREFQSRAKKKIDSLLQQYVTVCFASHNLEFIQRMCKHVILISHGRIAGQGNATIIERYKKQPIA